LFARPRVGGPWRVFVAIGGECLVTVRKVNIVSVEGDEALDAAGFRHVQTSLRPRLGAFAIGATIYEAFAGQPIWPYGYHHGVEEWLYVIAGKPVLREPAGERALMPGDLVCFPSGHLGAHALAGPGRLVIFSTGDHVEPWLSVYPDSDKVSGPDGIFPRGSAVGYWHREGTGAPVEDDPVVLKREPESTARRPVINALSIPVQAPDPEAPAGFRARTASLGPLLQAERVGTTVVELDEGEGSEPYHYQYGREEWALVLTGTPTLRHPAGTEELAPGDLVCFPEGPAGAHRLTNSASGVTRVVLFETLGLPANVHYPDSGKWLLRNGPDAHALMLRDGGPVGYWDREA
jgi:uncharacterized cupin superfamily protein